MGVSLRDVESAAEVVHRHVVVGYHLVGVRQSLLGLVGLAFGYEVEGELGEQAPVGVAHAHYGLVEVDALLVDAAVLEACHHVVVYALGVEALGSGNVGGERRYAVGESFLYEVVAEVHVVLGAYGYGHVYRACPVALRQHLEHHQVVLVQCVLAFERDNHAVGYRVGGHHHAALPYGFLVDGDVERVGRYEVEVLVL